MSRIRLRHALTSCESLELRRLLATVTIGGTSGPDTIVVDFVQFLGEMQVTVNGHSTRYADADVDRFDIFALGGGDTIDVERTSDNRIMIDAGDGNDRVRFAPIGNNLGTLDADVTVRGGAGTDRIELDDSAVPSGGAPTSYDLMGDVFTRSPFSNPITFSDVEDMTIACGGRDDFIAINSRNVRTTVNGNGGNDTLMLATMSGDLSADVNALVTFDGGAGIDEVRVNDWAHASNSTYVIDTVPQIPGLTFIGRAGGFGGLDTFNNELYLLECGALHDRIELNSVLGPGASVRVKGNGGIDALVVGGRTGRLADVAGSITFDGGASGEGNTIELIDLGNTAATTYAVGAATVDLPGFAHLNYSSDDTARIALRAGPGASTIDVNALDASTDLTLSGGGGDDVIAIAGLTRRLADVGGRITATGGSDGDELRLFDAANTAASAAFVFADELLADGGFGGVGYGGFEQLTLDLSNPRGSSVALNALDTPLDIIGGSGSDQLSTMSGAAEELTRFTAPIDFVGGGGADGASLSDASSDEHDAYAIDATSLTHPGFGGLTHSGVEELILQASGGDNAISVNSTAPGTQTLLYGGGGSDRFFLATAGRDLQDIRGFVLAHGGAGSDTAVLDDTARADASTSRIDPINFFRDAFELLEYHQTESIVFDAGSGDDTVDVTGVWAGRSITTRGNGGNDRFNLGVATAPAGLAALQGAVHIEGGAGTNTAELRDQATTDNDAFTVTATQIAQTGGFGGLVYADLATLTVEAGSGNNIFRVNSTSGLTDIRLRGNAGDDFFEVNATHATKPVIIDAGAGSANVVNALPATTTAGLVIENNQTLQSLTLIGDARASIAGSGATVLTQFLNVLSGAQLDVGRGGVIVNYAGASSPLPAHRAQVTSGYNAGLWNGAGIISSAAASNAALAVGYAEASDVLGATGGTFMGRAVDATAVLIRQTRVGDANLDGTVNLQDFNRIASSFGASAGSGTWSRGDFNYDGLVNLIDFNRLAANFGQRT